MSIRFWASTLLLVALATAGCGTRVGKGGDGSGSAGSNPALIATITPIGHKATSGAGVTPVAITVRSGADVVLSGKNSDGGPVAIKTFAWAQTGGPSLPALPDSRALLVRTANTVNFRAPDVSQDTVLTFRLTVTDALGATTTADASVTVKPGADPDQFLRIPTVPHRFEVAVATAEGLAVGTADSPVCIRVGRQVRYNSRDGTQRLVTLPQLASLQADTAWGAAAGGTAAGQGGTTTLTDTSVAGGVTSFSNPRAAFDVPTFNDDDLFAMFNQPAPGETDAARAVRIAQQLVPSDVDSAQLVLSVSATPGSCDGSVSAPTLATKTMVIALLDSSSRVAAYAGGAATGAAATLSQDKSGAELTSDALLASQTTAQLETAQSTQAYYAALDPTAAKTTLDDWLDANCFDHTASDYGVAAAGANGAHAVYTNNFDLGFGRDMYFIKCTADHTNAAGTVTAHAGDMASVVVNYTSLEQAALKQTPIIAVAMEYSAAADGSNPTHLFPKFYVFAQDDRTGALKRIATANFDHRGQKYVPGACTSCHGGTLPTLPQGFTSAMTYPVIQDPTKDASKDATNCTKTATACLSPGDVDSAFMPWDLDSFLYSDTDPAFGGEPIGFVSGTPFTRTAQEPALKTLNAFAHATFQPEIETVPIPNGDGTSTDTQIDRFAASRALVEKWYGGVGLPNATYSDADTPAGWTAPAGADALYHNSFARTCRACHTANPGLAIQFTGLDGFKNDGYTAFVNEFANTATGGVGLGKAYTFQQGVMPAARLTMDRFWVSYAGGDSAAKVLATQLTQATGATDLLTSSGDAVPTGKPSITLTVNGSPADATSGKFSALRFTGARIDTAASFFVAKWTWSLCVIAAPGGACSPEPVVGSTTAAPGIDTSAFGNYQLTLVADNGFGQTLTQTYEIDVPDALPQPSQVNACPAGQSASFSATGPGAAKQLSVASCFTSLGDPPYSLQLSTDGVTYSPGPISASTLPWNAAVVPGTANIDPSTGKDLSVPAISFNFTQNATATSNNTVFYKLCDTDSECAAGNVTVAIASTLTPSSAVLQAYWDPQLNIGNYSAGAVSVVPGGLAIHTPPTPFASLGVLQNSLVLNIPSTDDVTLHLVAPTVGTLSSLQLTGTSPANLLTQVAGLTYTPPAGCVTQDLNGNALTSASPGCPAATVSINNTLTSTFVPTPPPPATGTVKLNILALASFFQSSARAVNQPSVYAIMGEQGTNPTGDKKSCGDSGGGCHLKGNSGVGVTWFYTADPGDGTKTHFSDTYTSILAVNPALITPGDPSSSTFYTAPCVTGFGTMKQEFASTTTECQIIYQWILEGAPND